MVKSRFSRELYVLSAVTFLFWVGVFAISPILPLHIVGIGASYMQLGLIMSFAQVVLVIARLPSGMISSNPGRRIKMFYVLMLMQSSTFFLYGLTTNVEVLFGVKALEAITQAVFYTSSMTTVSDIAPNNRRGEAIGVYLTSVGLSLMLGPFISSILVSFLSYRQLFFAVSSLPLLGFIILISQKLHAPEGPDVDKKKTDLNSVRRVLSSRNIVLTYLIFFAFSIPVNLFMILFPIYGIETLSLSASVVSLLFTFQGATNTFFRIPIGRVADRIERKIPLFLSQFLVALVFLSLSQIGSVIGLSMVFAIFGVAWGTNAVVGSTQIQNYTASRDRGVASSLQGMVFDIGGIIGSFIAGAVVPAIPINEIFKISAVMPVFGLLAVLMMKKTE